MRLPSKKIQCHLLPVGNQKRFDECLSKKKSSVTHCLLVMGRDVMRLPGMSIVSPGTVLTLDWDWTQTPSSKMAVFPAIFCSHTFDLDTKQKHQTGLRVQHLKGGGEIEVLLITTFHPFS